MGNLLFFHTHPYGALFVYILVEELGVFLPIPGDAVLLLFGVQSRQGQVDFLSTLLIVCAATLIGSTTLYLLSRWIGRAALDKYGHLLQYIHITDKNISQVERWMKRYGGFALVVARVAPGLRIVGTVAAGVLNVPYGTFIAATMAGTIGWVSIYYGLGSLLGRRYAEQIDALLANRLFFIILAIGGLIVWAASARYIVPWVRKRYGGGES